MGHWESLELKAATRSLHAHIKKGAHKFKLEKFPTLHAASFHRVSSSSYTIDCRSGSEAIPEGKSSLIIGFWGL
jgi:hypothetical protein